jgi:hypothetical protein
MGREKRTELAKKILLVGQFEPVDPGPIIRGTD